VGSELDAVLGAGFEALGAGDWARAKEAFETVVAGDDRAEAHFGLAGALFWLGDMSGTIDNYERAYAAFVKRPEPLQAAVCSFALVVHNKQQLANHAAARGWLQRAMTLIEENSLDFMRGFALILQAYETDDAKLRETRGREALELARSMGDLNAEVMALAVVGKGLCEQGRVAEGTALLDEAMAGALGGQSSLDTVVFTSCQTMVACADCAEFERAAEWVRASDRFTERYGCPFLYVECRTIYGRILLETGEWERAEKELTTALEMSGSADAYSVQASATLAELRLAQGRVEDAERLLRGWEGRPEVVGATARIHLIRGEAAAAKAIVQRRLETIGEAQIESAALLDLLGEAEIALGDADAAAARGRTLVDLGTKLDCRIIVAHGERLLGRASSDRGSLDAAIEGFVRLGMPYETARTKLALAQLADDDEIASSEASAALTAFDALGAKRDADAAAAFLRDRGLRASRGRPRDLSSLTKREQEVLDLLGEGLSNPDIAQRLFLSRRTVEHHVAAVLSKLGLKTRAEAAAQLRDGDR